VHAAFLCIWKFGVRPGNLIKQGSAPGFVPYFCGPEFFRCPGVVSSLCGEGNTLQSDLDHLFTLPLSEFTDGRNALAARLKRDKQLDDANRVKALGKPSVSAWAVNQLYWKHRDAYDRLTESGARFREAQSSLLAGKSADLRGPTDARRAALSELSRLAASLLAEAGHNPAPETMRRISATLEAMSVHVTLPDEQTAGHLTHDIDPPGFDSLTSAGSMPIQRPSPPTASKPVVDPATLKAALKDAERKLAAAREAVNSAEAELKKADADSKKAEKEKQQARERFEHASSASDTAVQIARRALAHLELETNSLREAEREAEKAIREFNSAR
jgi:hypothetical protein